MPISKSTSFSSFQSLKKEDESQNVLSGSESSDNNSLDTTWGWFAQIGFNKQIEDATDSSTSSNLSVLSANESPDDDSTTTNVIVKQDFPSVVKSFASTYVWKRDFNTTSSQVLLQSNAKLQALVNVIDTYTDAISVSITIPQYRFIKSSYVEYKVQLKINSSITISAYIRYSQLVKFVKSQHFLSNEREFVTTRNLWKDITTSTRWIHTLESQYVQLRRKKLQGFLTSTLMESTTLDLLADLVTSDYQ